MKSLLSAEEALREHQERLERAYAERAAYRVRRLRRLRVRAERSRQRAERAAARVRLAAARAL